jgi:hypothetical protein
MEQEEEWNTTPLPPLREGQRRFVREEDAAIMVVVGSFHEFQWICKEELQYRIMFWVG